jgi:hypothetical protein
MKLHGVCCQVVKWWLAEGGQVTNNKQRCVCDRVVIVFVCLHSVVVQRK